MGLETRRISAAWQAGKGGSVASTYAGLAAPTSPEMTSAIFCDMLPARK